MQILVGIMIITLGTGFTYALAQTDTPPQRPPAISEESRFQPEPPALTPPMGLVSQIMIDSPEANSTITIQVEPPAEPKVHKIVIETQLATITCSDGVDARASILHPQELTSSGFLPHVLTSDKEIIEFGVVKTRGAAYDFVLFNMNEIQGKMYGSGVIVSRTTQNCSDTIMQLLTIMDCDVGKSFEVDGVVTIKNGTYTLQGSGPNGMTVVSTYPDYISHCH